jgi:hypothetical protein
LQRKKYVLHFRWTSLDPLSYAAGDVNLYCPVGNNPLNSLDPTGLFWYPGKYLIQLRREYYRGLELDRQINERRARQGLPQLEPPPHWTSVAAAEIGDGLRIGLQANVNAAATATRSLVTLGFWAEPWEVWAVADEDRPYYESGFLAARVGWELLPSYGIGKLTQVPGRIGRWGRCALYWDTAQNAVQVGRGGYDIYENGLTWANGLQVGTGLLGLGGNYTTWRRLPRNLPNVPWSYGPLPSNYLGATDRFGNITIRPGLSGQALIDTVRHESVHRFFSPRYGPLRELRADIGMLGYERSHFLRYLEEALAQTYATRSLLQGLRHPLNGAYQLSVWRVILEGGGYGIIVGGTTYGAYTLSHFILNR